MKVIDYSEVRYQICDRKTRIQLANSISTTFNKVDHDMMRIKNVHCVCVTQGSHIENFDGRRYILKVPTNCQGEKVFNLLNRSTDLIIDFDEIKKLYGIVKMACMSPTRESPNTLCWTTKTLRNLHQQDIAGTQSTLVTLDQRCVVADWLLHKIYLIKCDFVDYPAFFPTFGLSDDFLDAYLKYRAWAKKHLREPVMAAARRATQLIADKLGLDRGSYNIEVTVL